MGVEALMKEVAGELEKLISTKTVVGDPITAAGKTLIPISKISMGFGSGGGEDKKEKEEAFGGGGGAGAKIEPLAFIVVSEEKTEIFRISEKHDIGKLAELVPEVVGKLKDFHGKKKKRVTDEEAKESKEDKERRKEGETEAGAKESETGQFRS
ncbi:MAG: GerW family sporulation protein [Methanosarcinaceae archaeon]|nr:GerW family sporulation protein [Methanosarcinaceae archaeon]